MIYNVNMYWCFQDQEVVVDHGGARGDQGTADTGSDDGSNKQPESGSGQGKKPKTSPPETVFKKLSPSYNRYTLLRDEL